MLFQPPQAELSDQEVVEVLRAAASLRLC